MPLQIIGAGLGRTGTSSMKRALEHLGYPCHHMMEMFSRQERVVHLQDALAGRPTDWDAFFEGFTAMVDYPAALYWEPLMAFYPDAKVLLTTRDAGKWWESVDATLFPKSGKRTNTPLMNWVWDAVWDGQFQGRFDDRPFAEQVFRDWNQRVIDTVPADRLIVHEVGSGWGPLCEGLGVPVPDVDYPHTNTREQFQSRRAKTP